MPHGDVHSGCQLQLLGKLEHVGKFDGVVGRQLRQRRVLALEPPHLLINIHLVFNVLYPENYKYSGSQEFFLKKVNFYFYFRTI